MDILKESQDSLDMSDEEEVIFNVAVHVYEGRDFVWLDTPTTIQAKFGVEKKNSPVHPPAKNPYYNEYFVFDFSGSFNQLMDLPLAIKIFSSKYGPIGKGLLASARFDLATIWLQPNHYISRKLIKLTHPQDPSGQVKGFLLCDLGILSPGVPAPFYKAPVGKVAGRIEMDEYFASELLGGGRLLAKYCVSIHRAVGLPVEVDPATMASKQVLRKANRKGKLKVRVYFAGMSGETSPRTKLKEPTWNEKLIFTEIFPPMYSRMRIDLMLDKKMFCTRYVNLFKISDANIKGFLPTFGPSFLHMYCPTYEYFGSLLIAVKTETVPSHAHKKKLVAVGREPINPLEESAYWNVEEFVVFALLNNLSSLDTKISTKNKYVLSLSVGDNEKHPYDRVYNHFLCHPFETERMANADGFQMKESNKKLTFFVRRFMPDTRHRLFVSNALSYISQTFAREIDKSYAYSEHNAPRATVVLINAVSEFVRDSSKLVNKEILAFTQLQHERLKIIKFVLMEAQAAFEGDEFTKAPISLKLKIAARHCKKVLKLVEDPQDNFPLILFKLYAKASKKVLAYVRFPLREIVFSMDSLEKGKFCGAMQTFNLKNVQPGQDAFGRMELYLWFGLYKSVGFALQDLPPGYEDISERMVLPRMITYNVQNDFTFRAHIYQGYFQACEDTEDGLCNASVQIFIGNRVDKTMVIPKTVSPEWRSTVLIEDVKVFGELSYLKVHPPAVVVEIHHQGLKGAHVVYGRFSAAPYIYTSEQEYENYPPPLTWYNVVSRSSKVGEILALFELFHRSAFLYESNTHNLNNLRIPDISKYLRPRTILYRWEVIFWGVRNLAQTKKKDKQRPITNPLVKIDFGTYSLASDTIVNLYEFPNFKDKPHIEEVDLPENILFHPPVIIRVYDGMSFGTSKYVGHCIIKNIEEFKINLYQKAMWCRAFTRQKQCCSADQPPTPCGPELCPQKPGCRMKQCYPLALPSVHVTGNISSEDDSNEDDSSEDRTPLIKHTTDEKPKPIKRGGRMLTLPESDPLFSRLKRMVRKKNVILETTFDEEGNLVTRTVLSEKSKMFMSQKEEDEKNFDWWTKYFEAVDKTYELQQKSKLEGVDLQEEAKKLSVRETAKMLLNALTASQDRKESVTSTWKLFKHAIAVRFCNALPTVTVGGKLVMEADMMLRAFKIDVWKTSKLVIFETELEKVPLYGGFSDVLQSYPIKKDSSSPKKKTSSSSPVAYIKMGMRFYRWDGEEYVTGFGRNAQEGIYSPFPNLLLQQIPLVVRIYIVRCHRLTIVHDYHLDPYIVIMTPSTVISDREHAVRNEINPVFGTMFEVKATLPFDSYVTIRVMDMDDDQNDDLIGDTTIDIENRFFSKHRGSVGLAERYNSTGYNQWRDIYKPSEILESLCQSNNLPPPIYLDNGVQIGPRIFDADFSDDDWKECSALAALRNWDRIPIIGCHLVREHVESRSLYRSDTPGVEQGKLEMWVDLIPDLEGSGYGVPPPVNIAQRPPLEFELRVIIWGTKKVMKKDPSLLISSRHTDIYVAGWMEGKKDRQKTDVHYGAKGRGLFNWRFIFNFYYFQAEHLFVSKERLEAGADLKKLPPIVHFQIFDKERYRKDDPLGDTAIDIRQISRPDISFFGARLAVFNRVLGSTVDLFKVRNVRGWFPATQYSKKGTGPLKIIGFIDVEFQLLFKEEAIASPAGRGREDPNPLVVPDRPVVKITAFTILCAPCRRGFYYLYKYRKWQIMKFVLIIFLIWFAILFVESIPRHLVSMIFGGWYPVGTIGVTIATKNSKNLLLTVWKVLQCKSGRV